MYEGRRNRSPSHTQSVSPLACLLETVCCVHLLTWGDCWQLMATLFTAQQQDQIPLESRKLAQELGSRILLEPEAQVQWTFLSPNPVGILILVKVRRR